MFLMFCFSAAVFSSNWLLVQRAFFSTLPQGSCQKGSVRPIQSEPLLAKRFKPLAKGMGKKKQHDGFNNKGKPSGSGTTTQARRDRMKAKALAREAEEERLRLEEEEEEKKREKEKEKKEEKKEEEIVEVKVEEEKTLTKGVEEKKDLKVVEKEVEKEVEKKDSLAKKIQQKIDELQAPCPKDATLQPSNKQVEQWAGQGHMIWKKKVEIQKSPFDQSPCQKDSEAASSCQKRKKPPSSSSSSAPDWGDSSPEPSSAPETAAKVELRPCPKVPDPPCQKALPEWVAIDWFQTIEVREGVWDMEALELLREARVKVWVVSFAGKAQAGRVFAKCDWLAQEGLVDHVTIVKEKTGPQGKVALMRRRGGGPTPV